MFTLQIKPTEKKKIELSRQKFLWEKKISKVSMSLCNQLIQISILKIDVSIHSNHCQPFQSARPTPNKQQLLSVFPSR